MESSRLNESPGCSTLSLSLSPLAKFVACERVGPIDFKHTSDETLRRRNGVRNRCLKQPRDNNRTKR